jgi:SAM-dependent methyltransferase
MPTKDMLPMSAQAVFASSKVTKENWTNSKNATFYEETAHCQKLEKLAEQAGLHTGVDVQSIFPLLFPEQRVLEVGGAYGRVVQHLLDLGYQGKVDVIEKNQIFYELLSRKFSVESNQVNVIYGDVLTQNFIEKYNVVLWLWAGIADFSKQEQATLFQKFSMLLKPKGVLIVDTVVPTSLCNGFTLDGKNYVLPIERSTMYGYNPDLDDFNFYLQSTDLKISNTIKYCTTTKRDRLIYFFQKNHY